MRYEDYRHALRQELLRREVAEGLQLHTATSQSDLLEEPMFSPMQYPRFQAPPTQQPAQAAVLPAQQPPQLLQQPPQLQRPPLQQQSSLQQQNVAMQLPPPQPPQQQVQPAQPLQQEVIQPHGQLQQDQRLIGQTILPEKLSQQTPQSAAAVSSSEQSQHALRHQMSAQSDPTPHVDAYGNRHGAIDPGNISVHQMDRKVSSSSLPDDPSSHRPQPFMQIQLKPFRQLGSENITDRNTDISDSGGDLGSFSGASLPSTASPSIGRHSSASGSSSANNILSDQSPTAERAPVAAPAGVNPAASAPAPFAPIQLMEPLRTLDDSNVMSHWPATTTTHQQSRSVGSDDSSHRSIHRQGDSRSNASQNSMETSRYVPGESRSYHSVQSSSGSAEHILSSNPVAAKPSALSIISNDTRRPSLGTDSPMSHPELPLSLVQQRDAIYGQNTEYV